MAAAAAKAPIDIVFDMETGDPDDVLTLLLLAGHPRARLRAVTVTPGTRSQVGLIRWILQQMGVEGAVRVGAQRWPENADKPIPQIDRLRREVRPSDSQKAHGDEGGGGGGGGFYAFFQVVEVGDGDCERAADVLLQECDERTTLLTGAALHNLGDVLEIAEAAPAAPQAEAPARRRRWGGGVNADAAGAAAAPSAWRLGRWVAQGGFAGVGVVDPGLVLGKFAGLRDCPTWNFDGNVPAARAALDSPRIGRRVLASKNVCHRVMYDQALHRLVGRAAAAASGPHARGLGMVHASMEHYLRRRREGKKFHDPLAFALCLDEGACALAEVELTRAPRPAGGGRGGGWGSVLRPGSGTYISVDYDPGRFAEAILGLPLADVAPRELAEYCAAARATW